MERRISVLSDAQRAVSKFAVGGWVWVYNTAATIRQGTKTDTDVKVLKVKLSLNWTCPNKVLAVRPCTPADTPDGSPLGAKVLYWIYPSTCPARILAGAFLYNAASPVPTPATMATCRSISHRVDAIRARQYLQESLPYRVTQDDVSIPLQRLEEENITGHQSVRGRGAVIAVMYETH